MSFKHSLTAAALVALGVVVPQAEAASMTCSFGQYIEYLDGFALGFQTDTSDESTDCFGATSAWTLKIGEVEDSFKSFSMSDYLAPVYIFQELLVSQTTVFNDCQTTNAAKQLLVRTTQWSGIFDLFGTMGAAYLRQDIDPGTSTLYTAFTNMINPPSGTKCISQAKYFGTFVSSLLNFNTPDEVYYDLLTQSLG